MKDIFELRFHFSRPSIIKIWPESNLSPHVAMRDVESYLCVLSPDIWLLRCNKILSLLLMKCVEPTALLIKNMCLTYLHDSLQCFLWGENWYFIAKGIPYFHSRFDVWQIRIPSRARASEQQWAMFSRDAISPENEASFSLALSILISNF